MVEPKNISSCALEVLFQAAFCTGLEAGQIKWESAASKHLRAGNSHWRFSSDSGRSNSYWDAVWELVGYGYVRHVGKNNLAGDEYSLTDSGYEVAEDCCQSGGRVNSGVCMHGVPDGIAARMTKRNYKKLFFMVQGWLLWLPAMVISFAIAVAPGITEAVSLPVEFQGASVEASAEENPDDLPTPQPPTEDGPWSDPVSTLQMEAGLKTMRQLGRPANRLLHQTRLLVQSRDEP